MSIKDRECAQSLRRAQIRSWFSPVCTQHWASNNSPPDTGPIIANALLKIMSELGDVRVFIFIVMHFVNLFQAVTDEEFISHVQGTPSRINTAKWYTTHSECVDIVNLFSFIIPLLINNSNTKVGIAMQTSLSVSTQKAAESNINTCKSVLIDLRTFLFT